MGGRKSHDAEQGGEARIIEAIKIDSVVKYRAEIFPQTETPVLVFEADTALPAPYRIWYCAARIEIDKAVQTCLQHVVVTKFLL